MFSKGTYDSMLHAAPTKVEPYSAVQLSLLWLLIFVVLDLHYMYENNMHAHQEFLATKVYTFSMWPLNF